ncbi:MAG: hypothetical protein HC800_03390 [Phormidesmis sp. RL_2_1]|nr:hypothetical protein [Phormidesmis sp. RL_2_1]
MTGGALPDSDSFRISPLIRLTLMSLYIALVIPLPFLAEVTQAPVPPSLLWVGVLLGAIALHGGLSEQVQVDAQGIALIYPSWVRALGRRGWALRWAEISALKPRSTGQGGIVYYFLTQPLAHKAPAQPNQLADHQVPAKAYLLPMRVVGFARLVRYIQAKTEIDTRDVKPLGQPWMYVILLALTLLLLLVDIWVIGQTHTGLLGQP